jgi:hypothetical protein
MSSTSWGQEGRSWCMMPSNYPATLCQPALLQNIREFAFGGSAAEYKIRRHRADVSFSTSALISRSISTNTTGDHDPNATHMIGNSLLNVRETTVNLSQDYTTQHPTSSLLITLHLLTPFIHLQPLIRLQYPIRPPPWHSHPKHQIIIPSHNLVPFYQIHKSHATSC